jgi:hypothetical protein
MKTRYWMMMFLAAGLLALAGCSKEKPATPVMDGVTIDLPKLKEAFATAGPDAQTSISEVTMGMRYSDYPRAFAALAKLDSTPGATEAQKKVVADVTQQVKQAASKNSSPPAQ